MPILAIIAQPSPNSLTAAYRPIILRVTASATNNTAKPPVVYCDIYFNDVFYKTISKTQYISLGGSSSTWQFDIQDAAQERLRFFIAANGGSSIVEATPVIAKVLCKFRSSGYDSNGFIATENIAPVQGTSGTAPVSGTGTSSNEFWVLNTALQHEDNQILANHLSSYKTGTWSAANYPLTHRPPLYKIAANASDYFPVIVSNPSTIASIAITYRYLNQTLVREAIAAVTVAGTTMKVLYVPNGFKNIVALFPAIDYQHVFDYTIQLRDASNNTIASSTLNQITQGDANDRIRVHFLNYAGTIDAMDFCDPVIVQETTSESYEVPEAYPLSKSYHALNRFNVKSNDTYSAKTIDYNESDMAWIGELMDSPVAWLQWKGTQGQNDDYLPIVITDRKSEKRKEDDRYTYETVIEFKLSHQKFTIRN